MNLRELTYTSGAGLTVAHVVQQRTGQRVAVIDPHRRAKAAIVALLMRGVAPRAVARALGLPFPTVCALGISALSSRKNVGLLG